MRQKWRKTAHVCIALDINILSGLTNILFLKIMVQIKNTPTTTNLVGKPTKSFSESLEVTKHRRIYTLSDKKAEELNFATQMTWRAQGFWAVVEMVKSVCESAKNAQQLNEPIAQRKESPIKVIPDEPVDYFVQKKLTKSQYKAIHNGTKKHYAD